MKINPYVLSRLIKRLEWSEERQPCPECRYNHVIALSPIGEWRIEWKGWKANDWFCVYLEDCQVANEPNLETAKAAAQSIFTAKVLQCFSTLIDIDKTV